MRATGVMAVVLASGLALVAPHVAAEERTLEQRALDAVGQRSFQELAKEMKPPAAALTLFATAVGCHWRYAYSTPAVTFDPGATPCATSICRMGLDPDRAAALPAGAAVRLIVTSADKLRVLAVPTLGLQVDAVPGRVSEVWLQTKVEGVFAGRQGADCVGDRTAIPPAFRALDRRAFDEWVEGRRNGK